MNPNNLGERSFEESHDSYDVYLSNALLLEWAVCSLFICYSCFLFCSIVMYVELRYLLCLH